METRISVSEPPPARITAPDIVPVRRGARLPFLDWTRGLAVLLMIATHVFNCFTREDLRDGSAYVFSQFLGGMAAPLFLFLAGITLAFQMESQDRSQPSATRRSPERTVLTCPSDSSLIQPFLPISEVQVLVGPCCAPRCPAGRTRKSYARG